MSALPGADGPPLLLVGGGLANGLIALRLAVMRPEIPLLMIEREPALGGNHTWSFFETDLVPEQQAWIEPLITYRWPRYRVRFPARERLLSTGYASIASDQFDRVLSGRLGAERRLTGEVTEIGRHHVVLADGRRIEGSAVIDGRGPEPTTALEIGFQKFLGQELELEAPHGVAEPVIMDASVPQDGGYRFVYLLPFSDRRILIEDTRYTDGGHLDREAFRAGIAGYAAARGWRIARSVREEEGVLPVALDGDIEAFWRDAGGIARAGLRAAIFHPTTGYSLPDAVRVAERLAALPSLTAEAVEETLRRYSIEAWQNRRLFRLLNRMLFRAAIPEQRYRVLQRFYGLGGGLIRRFYAARLTWFDNARLLTGKPPVPMGAAIACVPERRRVA